MLDVGGGGQGACNVYGNKWLFLKAIFIFSFFFFSGYGHSEKHSKYNVFRFLTWYMRKSLPENPKDGTVISNCTHCRVSQGDGWNLSFKLPASSGPTPIHGAGRKVRADLDFIVH